MGKWKGIESSVWDYPKPTSGREARASRGGAYIRHWDGDRVVLEVAGQCGPQRLQWCCISADFERQVRNRCGRPMETGELSLVSSILESLLLCRCTRYLMIVVSGLFLSPTSRLLYRSKERTFWEYSIRVSHWISFSSLISAHYTSLLFLLIFVTQ